MERATGDAGRVAFPPNAWEILVLREMNQMCPVTQAGLWEIWACVCQLFTACAFPFQVYTVCLGV